MIALLGALREEISRLKKRMIIVETISADACTLFRGTWQGREILLVQTGMGKQRAQAATRHVLEHYPITLLVSQGFTGALEATLCVGDIVLYSAIHCAHPDAEMKAGTSSSYGPSDERLARALHALEGTAGTVYCRPGVTVLHPVLSPEEKQRLADTYQAAVVDMESYWIAEIASEKQIPALIIRTVSDTLHEKMLPIEEMMTNDGHVLWRAAVGYFLCRPQHLAVVRRLAINARVASRNLTTAIDSLITEL